MTAIKLLPTPVVAITRALCDIGLKPGKDFRVRQLKSATGTLRTSVRIGHRVDTSGDEADRLIAEHADRIEHQTTAVGWPFRVVVHRTRTGRPVCTVSCAVDDHT